MGSSMVDGRGIPRRDRRMESDQPAYHGLDRRDRIEEFIRAMREKHPDMPLSFEEQLQEGVRELESDKELARREGLSEEDMQD